MCQWQDLLFLAVIFSVSFLTLYLTRLTKVQTFLHKVNVVVFTDWVQTAGLNMTYNEVMCKESLHMLQSPSLKPVTSMQVCTTVCITDLIMNSRDRVHRPAAGSVFVVWSSSSDLYSGLFWSQWGALSSAVSPASVSPPVFCVSDQPAVCEWIQSCCSSPSVSEFDVERVSAQSSSHITEPHVDRDSWFMILKHALYESPTVLTSTPDSVSALLWIWFLYKYSIGNIFLYTRLLIYRCLFLFPMVFPGRFQMHVLNY